MRTDLNRLKSDMDSNRSLAAGSSQLGVGLARRWRQRRWRLAAGAALFAFAVSVVAFNVAGWRDRLLHPGATPQIRSLAVLPFQSLSGDHQQDYLVDGTTDEVITDLAKLGKFDVISLTSTMRYKRTQESLPQIAREFRADAIVDGTVLREGNRVRVTAQLIRGATGRYLWADSYERAASDVLALQSDVAQAIARQIVSTVTPRSQAHPASPQRVNPEAYDAYLRGRYFWNKRTPEGSKGPLVTSIRRSDRQFAERLRRAGIEL